jgi:hypothetical protein
MSSFADVPRRPWRWGWGAQSAPSIACLWEVAFALNKLTTNVHRRFAPIANSQVADRLIRSSSHCRNWNFRERIYLISNNLARGISVAYRPQSTTKHNRAQLTPAEVLQAFHDRTDVPHLCFERGVRYHILRIPITLLRRTCSGFVYDHSETVESTSPIARRSVFLLVSPHARTLMNNIKPFDAFRFAHICDRTSNLRSTTDMRRGTHAYFIRECRPKTSLFSSWQRQLLGLHFTWSS